MPTLPLAPTHVDLYNLVDEYETNGSIAHLDIGHVLALAKKEMEELQDELDEAKNEIDELKEELDELED